MIDIQHKENSNHPVINLDLTKLAVARTLSLHDKRDVDITVRFTDDAEVHRLNKLFRNIDQATDVLAFNQNVIDPQTGHLYLGDIVISLDRACLQAPENQHGLDEECALLAIHGTLHLLGYDHEQPKDKVKMWALQKRLLTETLLAFQEKS